VIDTVGGFVLRDHDGDLIGLKCPISHETFHGLTCERDQFHHTLRIMQQQGMESKNFGVRWRMYLKDQQ
jgi:hypothetical protein